MSSKSFFVDNIFTKIMKLRNRMRHKLSCKYFCCGSIKSRVKFYFWIFPTVWKKVNWVWWQFVCLGAIALCWTQSDGSKCQFSTRNPTLIFQQSQNPDSGPHGSKIIVRLRPSKIIYSKNDPSEWCGIRSSIRIYDLSALINEPISAGTRSLELITGHLLVDSG